MVIIWQLAMIHQNQIILKRSNANVDKNLQEKQVEIDGGDAGISTIIYNSLPIQISHQANLRVRLVSRL